MVDNFLSDNVRSSPKRLIRIDHTENKANKKQHLPAVLVDKTIQFEQTEQTKACLRQVRRSNQTNYEFII